MEIQPLFALDADTDVSAVEDAAASLDDTGYDAATTTEGAVDHATNATEELDDSVAVLAAFRDQVAVEDAAGVAQLELAVTYASYNSAESLAEAAVIPQAPGIDAAVPLAGEGAPWISEFAVVEFAAATGRSTDAARHYLGEALELAYRLPRTWAAVKAGQVTGWRARRVAARTQPLPPSGAEWVDGQVAPVAGRIGPTQLDRIISEAITRYDPEAAAERQFADLERRHVDIHPGELLDGATATATLDGVLDLADGLDLHATLTDLAAQLKALGSTDPLRVRRAQALGHLARGEYLLTPTGDGTGDDTDTTAADGTEDTAGAEAPAPGGTTGDPVDDPDPDPEADAAGQPARETDARSDATTDPGCAGVDASGADAEGGEPDDTEVDGGEVDGGEVDGGEVDGGAGGGGAGTAKLDTGTQALRARQTGRRVRELVLNLRINHAAIWGCGDGFSTLMTPGGRPIGQVMIEQIQQWCAQADTRVTIKPILDIEDRLTSHGYQPSDRLRDQATLLHPRCVFPFCNRSSATADLDHIEPWQTGPDDEPIGGATDSDNLAPLCRLHHRAKTHDRWTYTRLTIGEYLWTSPHGYRFHVTTQGTTDITHTTSPTTRGQSRNHANQSTTDRHHHDGNSADPPGRPTPRP